MMLNSGYQSLMLMVYIHLKRLINVWLMADRCWLGTLNWQGLMLLLASRNGLDFRHDLVLGPQIESNTHVNQNMANALAGHNVQCDRQKIQIFALHPKMPVYNHITSQLSLLLGFASSFLIWLLTVSFHCQVHKAKNIWTTSIGHS